MAPPTRNRLEEIFEFICHPPSSHLGSPDLETTPELAAEAEQQLAYEKDVYHHRIHFNQFQLVRAPS